MSKTKTCILCCKPTTGSVGAAGIKWSMICQLCKDEEDNALRQLGKWTSAEFMKALGLSPTGDK